MRSYTHPSLLIIDEIGFLPITPGGTSLFFQLVNDGYEKGAMILTSNLGFAELTRKQLQRGLYRSVEELEAAINEIIVAHNDNPTPFKWTKSADDILSSVKRFCHKITPTE